ncbi:helix-turn-helix transcriptional regulator [Nocardia sp. NPDC051570]|uniref:helix-turn-helix transcriptional regulator n=1 Tax=Nocardia sp. NPDC051570 TaxID=3364324 RepID=UPI003793EB53
MTAHARDGLERLLSAPTLSANETAQLLGLARSTVYAGIKAGEIPAVRVRRSVRVPSSWVRRVLQVDDSPEDPVSDN